MQPEAALLASTPAQPDLSAVLADYVMLYDDDV